MQKILYLALAICATGTAQAQSGAPNIERKIDMPAFSAIGISGSTNAEITVGPARSILLRGPQKLVDGLEVSVKDGSLHIKRKKENMRWEPSYKTGVTAIITTPVLNRYAVSGSGDAVITGIKAEAFGVAISGSGDVRASGSCGSLNAAMSGSGDLDATDLQCDNAKVAISGSSDSKVFARKDISIAVSGSGDVKVAGAPMGLCDIRVAGSGDVAMPGRKGSCNSKIAGSGEVTY